MDAAATAVSAAAAASKEAALAAADAREAAVEASAAALKAQETAVTASAAALYAKEAADAAATAGEAAAAAVAAAAVQASMNRELALNADEAAPVAATAGEAADVAATAWEAAAAAVAAAMEASKKRKFAAVVPEEATPVAVTACEAAAALQASKKHKLHISDMDEDPPVSGDGDVDLIGHLPDAVLCSIVSLLPTKDGARTQAVSRRWRPLWRSAPLNLVADREPKSKDHFISKVLSVHPGPARRFSLCLCTTDCHAKIDGWLSSQALDKLQDFELIPHCRFDVRGKFYLLPASVLAKFAPTLRVAQFGGCRFTDLIMKLSLKFSCLKQLTLDRSSISEDALQSMLSGCYALESLELKENAGFRRLRISSQTLKSIGFSTMYFVGSVPLQELIIEDAPCLERLLSLPESWSFTMRVISAPKLNILGVLSESVAELQFGTAVFQRMVAVGLTTKMHNVRVLVLDSPGRNLDTVVNFLKSFPCLERLYIIFSSSLGMYGAQNYDPLDPIECLELHLKEVLLKNYDGTRSICINYAKFFVLNAKVLKEMKITLPYHRQYNWFANQHRLIQTKDRASRDARIELRCGKRVYFTHNRNTHDLSMADPFDVPSSGCSKCSGSPF